MGPLAAAWPWMQAASRRIGSRSGNCQAGMTLVELMLATTILSVSVLGLLQTFGLISRSVQASKSKSIATNLAQEKIESLKDVSYYRLLVTTNPLTETSVTPNFDYDGPGGHYPPEIPLTVGGIRYDRRVYIHKVAEDASGDLIHKDWSEPDTGLKEIRVYVLWKQGTEQKHLMLRNLRDNPVRLPADATFSGNVKDNFGVNLAGVKVEAIQDPVRTDDTDSSGDYSFQVVSGSYTLRASKTGYFTAFSPATNAPAGQTTSVNFTLVKQDSGTVKGTAYIRDHIVISQVVASTVTGADNMEYVELYNPTTWTWTLDNASIDMRYVDPNNTLVTDISLNFINTTIPANGGYYLIANTGTVVAAGTTVAADAVYSTLLQNVIRDAKAGGIKITNDSDTLTYDKVGWSKTDDFSDPTAPAQAVEGSQVTLEKGLQAGEQIVRSSESFPTMDLPSGASAWDSNNNALDFNQGAVPQDQTLTYAPKNSGTIYAPKGGTPASGALVFGDDGLAPAVSANSSGAFSLVSVATGTWTITIASGTLMRQFTSVAVTANTTTDLGTFVLTSTTTNGYVTGRVTDGNNVPLSNIQVTGPAGPTLTGSAGTYALSVSMGTIEVVANPGNLNSNYVSSARTLTVTVGSVAQNTDFVLSKGARIRGFASTNGTDALPGLIVTASLGGTQLGTALSESDGYYTLTDLSTGTWTIEAQPDAGESASPTSFSQAIAESDAGTTLFVGTFTISGALGKISGTVEYNNVAIETGVMVVASTSTISDPPPAIDSTFRTGTNLYYGTSSGADGKYSIPVPGGSTYNVSAWYKNAGGATVRKTDTAPVTVGATTTRNLDWP